MAFVALNLFIVAQSWWPLALLALLVLGTGIWWEWQASKTYEPKKEAWARARALWDEAYYCAKHDVVFAPGWGDAQKVTDAESLWNSQ